MKNAKHLFTYVVLIFLSASCKKESTQIPDTEYQETRRARITQVELTDKDFRQYFIYREDGLLDSVKREGIDIGDFSSKYNLLSIGHYDDHIRVYTQSDQDGLGYWLDVKFFTQNNRINGSQFLIQPLPTPQIYNFLKINYSTASLIMDVEVGTENNSFYPFISDIQYEENKISQFKVENIQYFMPLEFLNIAYYDIAFSYKHNTLISPDIIKFINNSLFQFVNAGEIVDEWGNLVYGLTGYELPIQEKKEIVSQIQYKAYSKEDGSLLLDSTVTFDYQVDTLNKKISFGNQIVSYEFY